MWDYYPPTFLLRGDDDAEEHDDDHDDDGFMTVAEAAQLFQGSCAVSVGELTV